VITNGRYARPFSCQVYASQTDTNYSFEEDCMLVTFTTDAYANITMFGDVALTMLKMMGHSGTVPSAILAADVPVALSRLTAAIDAENASPPVADEDESVVSMANRGLPLIDLLTAAAKSGCNVMWK
jgi:hypothetical protein